MKSAAFLALTLALLSGCANDPSKVDISADVLPSLQGYSDEFQDQLLDEYLTCTKCEALKQATNDYLTMRDETRAAMEMR